MVSATKDPLTFNDLMATPIDLSKYMLNRLKIENLNQDILLEPAFNLLKGTCSSSIELELPRVLQRSIGIIQKEIVTHLIYLSLFLYKVPQVTYTTSITKTKAARYEIKGIEDMVPSLWSTIKHAYDKDAEKRIKHWGKRRKLWYRSQISKFFKNNILVKRSDQQLYKFKEDDFVDLRLEDIEYMFFLAVQHKLFHLDGSDIVDFIVAL
ncbi:hypothetical protein Tco_0624049 [Tanacetum coccineum]|uniref:Uncharacterized protein n=1 Tax=Tanacetum coccineum TaxID=301880 RepID=A0ABQ4WCP8_9ASTR